MNLDIFDQPPATAPVQNNPKKVNLREAAGEFITSNPKVMELFERFALQMAAKGRLFGVKLLCERIRWEFKYEYEGDLKLNNNYTAYIGRWLIVKHPHLRGYIRMRGTYY